MTQYLIYFNQQWVGDHDEEWFRSRGPLANAVVEDIDQAFSADATSGEPVITDGPYRRHQEYLGGLTVIDVPDRKTAEYWAGRIAEACGWPQEVREVV